MAKRSILLVLGAAFAGIITLFLVNGTARADTQPSVPTNVVAYGQTTAGTAVADVFWGAPTDNGGSALTYEVTTTPATSTFTTSSTSKTVTGLTPGTTYTFTVKAINGGGLHNSATSPAVDVLTAPGSPTNVAVSKSGSTISVDWDAPSDPGSAGGLTGYMVTPRIGGVEQPSLEQWVWAGDTSIDFTSLTRGQSYTFAVKAWSGYYTWGLSAPGTSASIAWYSTPTAPTGVIAYGQTTAGTAVADVSWGAPSDNGGSALTYEVTTTPATSTSTTSSTSKRVTGLTPGTTYTFTVKAINAGGLHNSATSSPLDVLTAAGAPTNVTASTSGSTITVGWDAPSDPGSAGGITGYTITPRIGGTEQTGLMQWVWAGEHSIDFTSLTRGQSYTFVVHTWTGYYTSALSAPSTPSAAIAWYGTPTAPTSVIAYGRTTAGTAVADVSWVAPSDNGGSALTYEVTTTPATSTFTTSSTSKTVTGLTPGTTYTFTVKAINAGGLHNSATSSSVEVLTAAGAPTNVGVSKSGSTITVDWDDPSDPGSAGGITGYTITPRINGTEQDGLMQWVWAGQNSIDFTSLTRGQSYTFVVRTWTGYYTSAISAPSTPSAAIAWYGTPTAPTNVVAYGQTTAGTAVADVSWGAPTDNGGSALTYEVTTTPATSTSTTSSTSKRVTGLTPGTSYTFTVKAINGGGLHNSATSSAVEVLTAAGSPTNVGVSKSGSTITVDWDDPTDPGSAGGITGYTITPRIGGTEQDGLMQWVWAGQNSIDFTSLTQGQSYTFVVRTWTGYYTSAISAPSTPSAAIAWYGTPSAPTGINAYGHTVGSNGSADVSWTAPTTTGGSSLTYEVTTTPATSTFTTSGTSKTVTGLTPGTTYTFTVKAINAGGNHNSATSSSVELFTAPGAPTGVTATKSGSTADVSWTAPADPGSAGGITGFVITPYIGSTAQTALQKFEYSEAASFTGLTPGQTYTFKVEAYTGWYTNAIGPAGTSNPLIM